MDQETKARVKTAIALTRRWFECVDGQVIVKESGLDEPKVADLLAKTGSFLKLMQQQKTKETGARFVKPAFDRGGFGGLQLHTSVIHRKERGGEWMPQQLALLKELESLIDAGAPLPVPEVFLP